MEGNALVTGKHYDIEKLRCNLCGALFQAEVPDKIANAAKYSDSAISAIALGRYGIGVPFKRRETFQTIQGVPLPDSTQWDLVNKVLYPVIEPIVTILITLSSEGKQNYFDDTSNRIIEASQAIHTTAMVSMYDNHEIHLFLTGPGCGLSKVFPILSEHDHPFITMCDAASANYKKKVEEALAARWILCLCLTHARRQFHDVLTIFPETCHEIIKAIGHVYYHDKLCKQRRYSDQKRLRYHQQHSKPTLDALYIWLTNQYQHPKQHRPIEPNSGLGAAIALSNDNYNSLLLTP
ncbi:MAG: transposase [Gammaproteobacteria bacterium]|nr:transposase [Gammaproteobacteria bacterium]